eukprot:scaffold334874_cov42-Prasinocladus_malaysianus.AAC.2
MPAKNSKWRARQHKKLQTLNVFIHSSNNAELNVIWLAADKDIMFLMRHVCEYRSHLVLLHAKLEAVKTYTPEELVQGTADGQTNATVTYQCLSSSPPDQLIAYAALTTERSVGIDSSLSLSDLKHCRVDMMSLLEDEGVVDGHRQFDVPKVPGAHVVI